MSSIKPVGMTVVPQPDFSLRRADQFEVTLDKSLPMGAKNAVRSIGERAMVPEALPATSPNINPLLGTSIYAQMNEMLLTTWEFQKFHRRLNVEADTFRRVLIRDDVYDREGDLHEKRLAAIRDWVAALLFERTIAQRGLITAMFKKTHDESWLAQRQFMDDRRNQIIDRSEYFARVFKKAINDPYNYLVVRSSDVTPREIKDKIKEGFERQLMDFKTSLGKSRNARAEVVIEEAEKIARRINLLYDLKEYRELRGILIKIEDDIVAAYDRTREIAFMFFARNLKIMRERAAYFSELFYSKRGDPNETEITYPNDEPFFLRNAIEDIERLFLDFKLYIRSLFENPFDLEMVEPNEKNVGQKRDELLATEIVLDMEFDSRQFYEIKYQNNVAHHDEIDLEKKESKRLVRNDYEHFEARRHQYKVDYRELHDIQKAITAKWAEVHLNQRVLESKIYPEAFREDLMDPLVLEIKMPNEKTRYRENVGVADEVTDSHDRHWEHKIEESTYFDNSYFHSLAGKFKVFDMLVYYGGKHPLITGFTRDVEMDNEDMKEHKRALEAVRGIRDARNS